MAQVQSRSRLPKWAQAEFARLERDLKYWQAKASEGPEGSLAFADPYSDAPRPLGNDPHVKFVTKDGKEFFVQLSPKFDLLEVRAGDGIVVYPSAANSITLEARRW